MDFLRPLQRPVYAGYKIKRKQAFKTKYYYKAGGREKGLSGKIIYFTRRTVTPFFNS